MAEFLAIHFQRDSVSTLINGSFNDTDNLFESTKKHIELTTSLGERLSYVQLSLNSSETAHRELIDIMYFMVNNPLPEVEKEYQRVGFKFTEKAGEVLKSEWTRLKQEM
ncbi:hypothetical protein C7441_11332 [Pseudaminobacter salicylatoxidans]|uniref:Uncharacterized protein n=2 Tax=Pseudaminobacter salicylatoxidans TaxID=93369 RepID=A0A316C0F9_PSESE|nr:hypothetical protein C7441_11332 [Pseudaminobacter salicylatoxidans]